MYTIIIVFGRISVWFVVLFQNQTGNIETKTSIHRKVKLSHLKTHIDKYTYTPLWAITSVKLLIKFKCKAKYNQIGLFCLEHWNRFESIRFIFYTKTTLNKQIGLFKYWENSNGKTQLESFNQLPISWLKFVYRSRKLKLLRKVVARIYYSNINM